MPIEQTYQEHVERIATNAQELRSVLLDPVVDGSTGKFISDTAICGERIAAAAKNSVYESAGRNAPMIAARHSRALQDYIKRHGRLPAEEVLASVHQSIANALALSAGHAATAGSVFESADLKAEMSTTDGILMRDRMVSLILPVQLQAVTTNMVTLIPGQFNQSEFFRIYRRAGSTFGDLKKGDRIDNTYNGRYTVMDQRELAGTGDGATTSFTLDTASAHNSAWPMLKKSVRVLHDHTPAGTDNGAGHLQGVFVIDGKAVNISGSVDYRKGTVTVAFSEAPAPGIEIHIGFDVDIESNPDLIPRLTLKERGGDRKKMRHTGATSGMPKGYPFPTKEGATLWNVLYLACRIWQFVAWYRPVPCLSKQPGPQRPNGRTARLQSCASRTAFGGSLKASGCMIGHRRSKFAATSTDAWNAADTSTPVCRESNSGGGY